jgi:hypothetical protein
MARGSSLEHLAQNESMGPVESFGFSGNWLIRPGDDPEASSQDFDGNGVPDECEVLGDIDGDGTVGIGDFLIMMAVWGPCPDPCPPACPADLDGNCDVGIADFLVLLGNWSS